VIGSPPPPPPPPPLPPAAAAQSYTEDVRRLRVSIECTSGDLFVDAPFTAAVAPGAALPNPAGAAATSAASAGDGAGIRSGSTVVLPAAGPGWPGAADWGQLHFRVGGGTGDQRMVFEGRLAAVRRALRGLRYRSRARSDPAQAAGGRVCTLGDLCGQVGARRGVVWRGGCTGGAGAEGGADTYWGWGGGDKHVET
jgi:hypothetical protein